MSTRPERIDVEIAHQYFSEGRALFIDARPKAKYEQSQAQIPGAVHISPGEGAEVATALRALPNEVLLIAYCDEPDQAASAQIARLARQVGLGDVSILNGGFDAWKEADLPLEPRPGSKAAEERAA